MASQIEEIKNKLNVLDVVGGYVKLTKTGANFRGICPFHSEKGPSFFVSPARQMWKCFGCGKGGDIFEFIKEIEGFEFGDALRLLANKAGIELVRENPQVTSERKRLYEICDLACSFFEKQLGNSAYGKDAKEYLLKRGIKEETIKKWRLGYSPDTWQGLSDFLVGRGYDREEIVKAGLAVQSEKGNNPYDRFRGRIIFPIFDLNSQVIGFGARIFKEADKKETAKYINTPQTMLYDKSNVLYGINYAKLAIRKNNHCVLTEGYTDAIMCHQAGFENTVAVSGTALTPRHLNTLKRYSENLLLAFDMDLAGDTATKRGINLAESQGFNIKVIDTYSGAKDPAEIILENPENWQSSVANARTIMDFYFDSAFKKFDKATPEGKNDIGNIILSAVGRIPDQIKRSHWIQKLSAKIGIDEKELFEQLRKKTVNDSFGQGVISNVIKKENEKIGGIEGRKKMIEEKIVSLVLKNPENLDLIEESHHCLFCEETRNLIGNIKKDPDFLRGEHKELFNEMSLKAEMEYAEDGPDEIKLCLSQLKDIELRNSLTLMSGGIKLEGDDNKRDELMKKFDKTARELHQS